MSLRSAWRGMVDGMKRRQERDKPKVQYYGGSEEALNAERNRATEGAKAGSDVATQGLADSREATNRANAQYAYQQLQNDKFAREQERKAGNAAVGFNQSMGDYRGARGQILNSAGKLESEFENANANYQATADKAFNANQNQATRNALAVGARGGASGIRAALASSTAANAEAAQQAEIIRAQEANQLLGLKQGALESAAGIRSNVAGMDQGAASQYAGREATADASRFGAYQQMSQNTANQAQLGQNLGAQGVEAGTAERGQYLDYQGNMENAQLNSEREREQLRVQGREKRRDFLRNPFGF